ncbi:MAG: signal peptidase I [Verrucomicrobia bacterium]|jgi:signal peptidase I|nr:signal peptidase I [Verrucomicrobiota bacterium]
MNSKPEHDMAGPMDKAGDPAVRASRSKSKPFNAVQWVVMLGLVFLSYFAFSRVGVQVVEVVGESMAPTLRQSDHYLLKKWVYLFRSPQRNEVVVLTDPEDHGFSVKRIIATEGETVLLKDGKVFVDGQPLTEPYLPPGVTTFGNTRSGEQVFRCGEGEFFVLGDNRLVSIDSREYGPVPRQNILGLILP